MKKLVIYYIGVFSVFFLATFFVSLQPANAQTFDCPIGYTCTPIVQMVPGCPVGFTCTPITNQTVNIPTFVNSNSSSINYPTSCHTWSGHLGVGSRGNDVVELQDFLISKGFDIPQISKEGVAKGYFGQSTASALTKFQSSQGIDSTGGLGPITRSRLNSLSCNQINTSSVISNTDTSGSLVITNIFGPTTIQQGQPASWTIVSNANSISTGRIMYSVDWGSGEDSIVQTSNIVTHSYPNAGSYAIKFQVYDQTSGAGHSTKTLYITVTGKNSSAIQVLAPQGGHAYNIGDTLNIKWSGAMKLISIKGLDTNTSRTIIQLPSSSAGDTSGSYDYVIPSDILSGFRTGTFSVSVYNSYGTSDPEIFNTSAPFTIQTGISACSNGQMWNGSSCVANNSISILRLNTSSAIAGTQITVFGTNFQQYDQACFFSASGIVVSCVNPSSFSGSEMYLTVPSITTGTYTVKVRRGDFLESNGLSFSVNSQTCLSGQIWNGSTCTSSGQPVTITVKSPTSGQSFTTGGTIPITWTSTGSSNLPVMILLERFDDRANQGSPVTVKTITTTNNGSYNIPIGFGELNTLFPCPNGCTSTNNTVSFDVRVIISTTGVPNSQSSRFTITGSSVTQPTLIITTPTGGGTYQVGSTLNIQWTATGLTQQNNSLGLAIYQTSLGSTKSVLSTTVGNPVSNGQVSNSGSYNWVIPATTPSGADYIVYLSNSSNYTQSKTFKIFAQTTTPSITITSPNGGENYLLGANILMKWEATSVGKSIDYVFLRDYNSGVGGRDYVVSVGDNIVYSNDNGSGQIAWTIPADIPEGKYKVVVGSTGANTWDLSDSIFSIYRP